MRRWLKMHRRLLAEPCDRLHQYVQRPPRPENSEKQIPAAPRAGRDARRHATHSRLVDLGYRAHPVRRTLVDEPKMRAEPETS
jgi:hypothetical protein